MPAQNRVTPEGAIIAAPLRCRWLGNRGCLHVGREIVRPWRSRAWITCETSYKDWRAPRWEAGRYTALFLHDEAVALAAGHRPCALCRRPAYNAFLEAWQLAFGLRPRAAAMDERLHDDRLDGRLKRRHARPWRDLPDGAFVDFDGSPALVQRERAVRWSPDGYGAVAARPTTGIADVLTPSATIDVLRHGYLPQVDPSIAMP